MEGDPPDRLKLARESYLEVLDATKHQDDKIGRLLTAVAFLTGGALVFANRGVLDVRYALNGVSLPLPGLAFGAFLVLVALSVLSLVLSLTTPLTLPRQRAAGSSPTGPSRLFFRVIAGETEATWGEMWSGEAAAISSAVEKDYVQETLNIAVRADRKYARTSEAALFVIGAMLFFSLAIVLSIDILVSSQPPERQVVSETVSGPSGRLTTTSTVLSRPPVRWTQTRRMLVGGTLAIFAGLLLHQYRRDGQVFSEMVQRRVSRQRKKSGTKEPTDRPKNRLQDSNLSFGILALSYPAFVVATVLGNGARGWWQSGAPVVLSTGVLSFGVAGIYFFGNAKTRRSRRCALAAAVSVGVVVVSAAVGSVTGQRTEWQLGVGVGGVLLLLVPNLVNTSLVTTRRLQKMAPAAPAETVPAAPIRGTVPAPP